MTKKLEFTKDIVQKVPKQRTSHISPIKISREEISYAMMKDGKCVFYRPEANWLHIIRKVTKGEICTCSLFLQSIGSTLEVLFPKL